MKFLITPAAPLARPLMSAAEFGRALRERWSSVLISRSRDADDTHELDWTVDTTHGLLIGSFGKDGETVIVDGDVRDAASVAHWFRLLVPSAFPLVFVDEGYSECVALEVDTQEEDIVAPFLAWARLQSPWSGPQ